MGTDFPGSKDAFTRPSPGDPTINSHGIAQTQFFDNVMTALEAIETKIGVNSSTDETTLDFKVKPIGTAQQYVKKPNGTDDTANFLAALNALPTVTVDDGAGNTAVFPHGTIYLGAAPASAPYKFGVTTDIGNLGPFVKVQGHGKSSCFIDYYGSGDCFRARNTVNLNNFAKQYTGTGSASGGTAFAGFTLSGSNASAGASGIHLGDMLGAHIDHDSVLIRDFDKTGSKGIWVDDTVSWTEGLTGGAQLFNCTTAVLFSTNGGGHVHSYDDLTFTIHAYADQDGVELGAGCVLWGCRLNIYMTGAYGVGSNSGAMFRHGGDEVFNCHFVWNYDGLALDGVGDTGHWLLYFVTSAGENGVRACDGAIHSLGSQGSNYVAAALTYFDFYGQIDTATLQPFSTLMTDATGGQVRYRPPMGSMLVPNPPGVYTSGTQTLDLATGDTFDLGQLTANVTLTFAHIIGAPQRLTIRAQQGTGGPWNITFPRWTGTPSKDNPNVKSPGGILPVLTTTASAVDVYDLVTYDGKTWFIVSQTQLQTTMPVVPVVTAQGSAHSSTTNQTHVPTTNTTVGNLLVLAFGDLTPGGTGVPTVSDTKSNTWTTTTVVGTTGARTWIAYTVLTSAILTTDSVHVAWSATARCITFLAEVTNMGASPVVDQSASGDSGTTGVTTLAIGPTATLATPGVADVVFSFIVPDTTFTGTLTWTTPSGYTLVKTTWNTGFGSLAYKVQQGSTASSTWGLDTTLPLTGQIKAFHA